MKEVIKFMTEAVVPAGLKRFMKHGDSSTLGNTSIEASSMSVESGALSCRSDTPMTQDSSTTVGSEGVAVAGPGYRPKKVEIT